MMPPVDKRCGWVLGVLGACTPTPSPSPDAHTQDLTEVSEACVDDCPSCIPGELSCTANGQAVLRCQDDGRRRVETMRCDTANGQLCAEGRCITPCAWAEESARNEGCSFVAVSTLNASLGHQEEGQSPEQFPFAVSLTNPWPVPAEIVLEGGALPSPRRETVPPLGAHTVTLPWVRALSEGGDPAAPTSTLARRGAYRLRSDVPVAAYQFNPLGFASLEGCDQLRCRSFTNDASLLLPVSALGRRYTVVSRPTVRVLQRGQTRWQRASGFVTIVAVEDGTEVTVRLRANTLPGEGVRAGAPGETLTHILDRGNTLQIVSGGASSCARPEADTVRGDTFCQPVTTEDLTGSVVTASAPVAVWAGHDCALVPYNRFACDHLEEQLLPDESLGRRYVAPRPPQVMHEPGVLRVVATRPHTRVTVEPTQVQAPITLAAAGDFVEFEHRESVVVTATEPVVVAQFLVGAGYDTTTLLNVRGDPAMALLPPVEQTRNRYHFVAAPGFPESVAVAFVPAGERLRLDDHTPTPPPVDTVAGFAVYHLRVTPGAHTLSALHRGIRFGLVVSGLAPSTSYTYPGGLDLAPIAPPQ